jgi:hypothetical protein
LTTTHCFKKTAIHIYLFIGSSRPNLFLLLFIHYLLEFLQPLFHKNKTQITYFKKMLSGTANPRIPAFIEGRCYACDRTFAYPASLIQHMSTIHQVNLSARKRGSHHPDISPRDYFVKKAEDGKRSFLGCPSCWFYSNKENNLKRLVKHIHEIHIDKFFRHKT